MFQLALNVCRTSLNRKNLRIYIKNEDVEWVKIEEKYYNWNVLTVKNTSIPSKNNAMIRK
jgi:hypothetical protein